MSEDTPKRPTGLPTTRHDALFRTLLTNPERAGQVLRDHLPEPIATRLAAQDPRLIDGSFVDEALRGSQADRLFEVTLDGGTPLLIYALLEHKSEPDQKTPLQLAGYMINIWKRYADEHPDLKSRLPAIIPIVFYHGAAHWTVPRSLFDLIEDDEEIRPFSRSMAYVLRDIGQMSLEQMSSRPEVRSVFHVLHISRRDRIGHEELADIIAPLVDGSDLESATLHYIVGDQKITQTMLEAALRQAKPERWEALMGTLAETWFEQGKADGMAEGEARGKAVGMAEGEARGKAAGMAEGEARGKAETFLQLARLKYGDLSEQCIEAVRIASATQLDHWLHALLSAETLEDIFNPPHSQ